LQEKISAGDLGMKTGTGFKTYSPEQVIEINQKMIAHLLKAVEV
jgi:3-hydroxyacyl-CoA dehydrogenase